MSERVKEIFAYLDDLPEERKLISLALLVLKTRVEVLTEEDRIGLIGILSDLSKRMNLSSNPQYCPRCGGFPKNRRIMLCSCG